MNLNPRTWNLLGWDKTSEVPCEPGCYALLDANDNILYIGRSKILSNRLRRPHKHQGFKRTELKFNTLKIAWCSGWDVYDSEKSLIKQWKPPLCKDFRIKTEG